MTTESDVEAVPEIEADDIELEYVPVRRQAVTTAELDGELVLINGEDDSVHVLNSTGSIVWNCFDGEGTLAEIAEDLAGVFAAPIEEVREDVVGLTRWIGEEGLLQGVVPTEDDDATPQGLEAGQELPTFTLPSLDGTPLDLDSLRGTPVLIVNWSPSCGYCERIAPDLATMQPALASRGVRLLFLSAGNAADNRELFEAHGLHADAMLREGAPDDFPDPFPGMGTPVAYLLDAQGRVDAPLAYGAAEVPELAATAGGIIPVVSAASGTDTEPSAGEEQEEEHHHDHAESAQGPRYIPVAGGVCNPGAGSGKKPRVWAATSAYAVGEYHVGVRADSGTSDEVLARVFSAVRLPPGTRAPDNYSVILGGGGERGTKELSLLLLGDDMVVRSRSPRRVVTALASHLSALLEKDDGLLRTLDVGALVDGEAVLLPADARDWLEEMQPRLARIGIRLSDEPYASIDLERLELVVPEPAVAFDRTALAEIPGLAGGRSELPPIDPGRYPLRAWGIDSDADTEAPTRAQALSATWGAVLEGQGETKDVVDRLGTFFSRVALAALAFSDPEQLVQAVRERLVRAA